MTAQTKTSLLRKTSFGFALALKAVSVFAMIVAPLLGVWLLSSIAAYQNATKWTSLLVGLLLFPILPLGWEVLGQWRRSRKDNPRDHILTGFDRLVLRTVFLSVTFLMVSVWAKPVTTFRALSTRGDWMLDGSHGGTANSIRGKLFWLADSLEGMYRRSTINHYGKSDDAPETAEIGPRKRAIWPQPRGLHIAVKNLPAEVEGNYASVARYLARKESDPFQLAKALHDYVIVRLSYDNDALRKIEAGSGDVPSQQPAAVFAAKTGVCEGYARLLAAMGKEAGVEIAYVVGRTRRDSQQVDGVGHAWNAAKIKGSWYLIDATWDDDRNGDYSTSYLFTPPNLFINDHFPSTQRWQLLDAPISAGQFMRRPALGPGFVQLGLELRSPTRSQVSVSGTLDIVIDNPRNARLVAVAEKTDDDKTECKTRGHQPTRITCKFPSDGRYVVMLYGTSNSAARLLPNIGRIYVNSR